ncbi:glycosyltransferase family 4 protein [bacterium]|nr:glycosyltransferase family 4 protein [bacterium]
MGKNIVYDARVCDGKIHGISQVAEQLLKQIIKLDTDNNYIVLCNNNYIQEKIPKKKNVTYKKLTSKVYSIHEQFEVLNISKKCKADLYHSPTFTAPLFADFPVIINIHDLIPLVYPEFFPIKYALYYKFFVKKIAKKAIKIVTCSDNSKKDISKFFALRPSKILVAYNSVTYNDKKKVKADKVGNELKNIDFQYLLYVGNEKPHKNFINAAKAFDILQRKCPRKQLKFVAVGISKEFFRQSAVHNIKNIICIKYLNTKKLEIFYKNAGIFLFPSLYEGYGLPPLEAMSYGVPVVSSNCSSMPEILGDAYEQVNPCDPDEAANAVFRIMHHEALRSKLIKKGYSQVKKYSWLKSAEKIVTLYKDILR